MSSKPTNGAGNPLPMDGKGPALSAGESSDRLDVRTLVTGTRLIVFGGTGFLGKVWVCALLYHFPEVEHVYLVVRQRKRSDGSVRQTSEARFWDEVASSEAFDPLRERYPGAAYEAFLREHITPIPGEVTEDFAGVPDAVREELRGTLSALVNASGVVDFNPPLDYALNVNAFGMQNLVALARDLSPESGAGLPFLHTSTCYVAGDRTGEVKEIDPLEFPFPRADELDRSHWDPEREIAECVDLVDNVRHRSSDAFRQSAFLDQAKKNLRDRKEPARGQSLQREFEKVKRKFEEKQLVDWGTERAQFWGWHNIYTYTKSIGEQILRESDLPHTIVRPAIVESALNFPRVGWCEGINTAAPLIYMAVKGPVHFPMEEDTILDFIPVDQVAFGMILALAELLEGRAKVVYQYGTSDTAPVKVSRIIELLGLYKREHYLYEAGGNPVLNWVRSKLEPKAVTTEEYFSRGPSWQAEKVRTAADLLGRYSGGPMKALTGTVSKQLRGLGRQLEIQARITDQFVPFMATHSYRFCCDHTKAAYERLDAHDKELLAWRPETMDWRYYMLEIQCPGVTRNVAPEIEAKLKKELQPLRRHDHLLELIDEMADRHDLAPALLSTHEDGFCRVSYRDLRGRTFAVAIRLAQAGVKPGDRVLISGKNQPEWPIAYFGILRAGGVAVPLDPALESDKVRVICASAEPVAAILDSVARDAFGDAISMELLDLEQVATHGAVGDVPRFEADPDGLASILYTSGTTGDPKGVMLSHSNFCAVLAGLGKLFPLRESDRVLSVLPLHHAFEFTCGMLLPLSMGARVIYLDEISADRLSYGLKEGRVTCMVGVPALWQLLERRIRSQVKERGQVFELAFEGGLELNRRFGRATGMDLGRLMFGSVHTRFGGNIRMLISGGAALPADTQRLFSGLGLAMSEGYGLTEAAPVLTVALPRPGGKAGNVGEAIPGVEIHIEGANESGVGEVWARGENVMKGYFGLDDATAEVLEADGWLKTGDMGRLDHKGRLVLVGRAKEVVVTSSGENIYLDDVENTLGTIPRIKEYSLVGLDDPRGGERLGMLAVPDEWTTGDRKAHQKKARDSIKDAIAELPSVCRPAVIHLVEADLPRTATRKVQRKDVRKILEKIAAAAPGKGYTSGEGLGGPVGRAIAAVAGVDASEITKETHLIERYGFDSLMWVELSAALAEVGTGRPDPQALSTCETVAEVIEMVGAVPESARLEGPVESEEIELPDFVANRLKAGMSQVQKAFNGGLLQTTVSGRAHIPQNRQVIVVSNHTSHLDMGLVKHALGPYGKDIAALAAQDYFFEGNKWKVAWFRHLTNVEPLDRRSGFRASMKQAKAVIDSGQIVLIFPEGTRQTSGQLTEFKPMVGVLALETGVDILPMWIDGAYESMPKGALLPRKRGIHIRIGPPLEIRELERLTEGMRKTQAARRVANIAREAVDRLRKGEVLDLSTFEDSPVVEAVAESSPEELARRVFTDLGKRYDSARIERPMSWYFALGPKGGPRWTVMVDKEQCTIHQGRPSTGKADCVVKTSTDIFTKIVKDAYVPEPQQFISGAIKTNDIPLLIEFSRVFNLNEGA